MSPIWTMPDGSRIFVPETDTPATGHQTAGEAQRRAIDTQTRCNLTRYVVNPYVFYEAPCGSKAEHLAVAPPVGSSPVAAAAANIPEHIRQFMREIGKRGGQARARQHSREEFAAWGRVRHQAATRDAS